MVVAVMAILLGASVCWAVIRHVSWVIRTWFETSLKREMAARGYAAQEIISVIKADRNCSWRGTYLDVPPAKPIPRPAYQ